MQRIVFTGNLDFHLDTAPALTGLQRLSLNAPITVGTVWNIEALTLTYRATQVSGNVDRLDMFLVLNNERILLQHFQPPSVSTSYAPNPSASNQYLAQIWASWKDTLQIEAEIANGNPSAFPPFLGFNYQVQVQGSITPWTY